MTLTAQQALMLVRQVEGRTTGLDKPAAWTQRSSSARSLENSLEVVGLEILMPYLTSPKRLVITSLSLSNAKNIFDIFIYLFQSSFGDFV